MTPKPKKKARQLILHLMNNLAPNHQSPSNACPINQQFNPPSPTKLSTKNPKKKHKKQSHNYSPLTDSIPIRLKPTTNGSNREVRAMRAWPFDLSRRTSWWLISAVNHLRQVGAAMGPRRGPHPLSLHVTSPLTKRYSSCSRSWSQRPSLRQHYRLDTNKRNTDRSSYSWTTES